MGSRLRGSKGVGGPQGIALTGGDVGTRELPSPQSSPRMGEEVRGTDGMGSRLRGSKDGGLDG